MWLLPPHLSCNNQQESQDELWNIKKAKQHCFSFLFLLSSTFLVSCSDLCGLKHYWSTYYPHPLYSTICKIQSTCANFWSNSSKHNKPGRFNDFDEFSPFCNKITDEHVIINTSFVEQLIILLSWVIKTGILVDLIPNSPNLHQKNCIAYSKENYHDLEIDWVK